MTIALLIEHDHHHLKGVTLHALTAAQMLNEEIDALVIGWQCNSVVDEVAKLPGIKNILTADSELYAHMLAENTATLIADIVKDRSYSYLIAASSTFSKNLIPRASALLDISPVTDVIKILTPDTFVRPIYAGNALATVQSNNKINILTIRTTAFSKPKITTQDSPTIIPIDKSISNTHSQFVKQELTQSTRPELTAARIVISGGRGLKSADNFKLLETLADKLNAAVGASRAAVDAGFAPNDYQVGQTGKAVAPDLYIAVGISGAIQHIAGMKDSKIIVAINSDPDAPIFQIADYGLVGDLFKILPELEDELTNSLTHK